MSSTRKIWVGYIKQHRKTMLLFALLGIIFSSVAWLYHMPMDGILYGLALCLAVGLLLMTVDMLRYQKRCRQLEELEQRITLELEGMPEPKNIIESEYQQILQKLWEDRAFQISKRDQEKSQTLEYYTLWMHQIKTPIAALHLLLQEDTAENRMREAELFKIEQYVEMALSYLRLDGEKNDLVLAQCDLASLVRQSVRKYAPLFIRSKLHLELEDFHAKVLTDEKWFCFAVEQILSNALKYTPKGEIRIHLEEPQILVIEDTGIGIAPEDLPRIGERGFTGYNGRSDKKATGLGLYLCRQVFKKLGHQMEIRSQVGIGTQVRINMESSKINIRD